MKRFLEVWSKVVGGLSIGLLVLGVSLVPPQTSRAQSGGGYVTCVTNTDHTGCTADTAGQPCGPGQNQFCTSNAQGTCVCP